MRYKLVLQKRGPSRGVKQTIVYDMRPYWGMHSARLLAASLWRPNIAQ
jgi:hypothetical protein